MSHARPRPVAVALLALLAAAAPLALVGAGATGAPAGADVVPVTNTTGQATPEVTERTYARAQVDVAGAVAAGAARLDGRHATLTMAERLDRAGTDAQRDAAVNATLDDAAARLDRLDDRQARLFAAYSAGTIGTATFLRRLAVLEAAAGSQRALLGEVSGRGRAAGSSPLPVALQTRIARLQADLVVLPNPVAERVVAAVDGTGPARTVYLEAGETGLVAATVADGTHVRVATLRDRRRPGAADQFGASAAAALGRAAELYPWLFENAIGSPSARGFGFTSVYLIEAAHPHGEIRSYIDGATRTAFHEIQTKDPAGVPVTANRTTVGEDLQVRIETTYPTGPMRVTVTRPDTGLGVEATVRVNGQPVGTTTPGGTLTTVQPTGPFEVNATAGTASVSVDGP